MDTDSKSTALEPESRVCRLTWDLEDKEQSLQVGEKSLSIGRAQDSDIVLSHESVSRHHARLEPSGQGWRIIDIESKNGVRLNTYRVTEEWLHNGDCIDIGAVRIYVDIGEPPASVPANVIFNDDEVRKGMRTEMIEMNHLDLLFGASSDLVRAPGYVSAAAWPELDAEASQGIQEPAALLRLFSKATEALITCDTLDETLDHILAIVFNSLPAERGVVCLYDEARDTIEPKVMRTLEGVPDEAVVISTRIARTAIEENRALLVQDTLMDDRFGGADSVVMMNIHSAMCAPLYRGGSAVGVIYVDRSSPEQVFQKYHLQALSALAMLSAVAVEQAALREDVRREQEIRRRLSRYSSPAVVERILKSPSGLESDMVADEGEVSVLFADLTDFTSMAENLRPKEVIQVLNEIFERLSDAVFRYEGTLDKFNGDGMMAFFGAPLAQSDHAERAVKAALRMQALLADVNANAHNRRYIAMRIGINSGPVVVGDIGSPQRRDYTVVGDVVNIASRLESSIAQPGQVVIGPRTYRQVAPLFSCQELETVRLKGRIRTVRPYLVLGRRNPDDSF